MARSPFYNRARQRRENSSEPRRRRRRRSILPGRPRNAPSAQPPRCVRGVVRSACASRHRPPRVVWRVLISAVAPPSIFSPRYLRHHGAHHGERSGIACASCEISGCECRKCARRPCVQPVSSGLRVVPRKGAARWPPATATTTRKKRQATRGVTPHRSSNQPPRRSPGCGPHARGNGVRLDGGLWPADGGREIVRCGAPAVASLSPGPRLVVLYVRWVCARDVCASSSCGFPLGVHHVQDADLTPAPIVQSVNKNKRCPSARHHRNYRAAAHGCIALITKTKTTTRPHVFTSTPPPPSSSTFYYFQHSERPLACERLRAGSDQSSWLTLCRVDNSVRGPCRRRSSTASIRSPSDRSRRRRRSRRAARGTGTRRMSSCSRCRPSKVNTSIHFLCDCFLFSYIYLARRGH